MSQEKRKFSVEDTAPVASWKSFGAQVNNPTKFLIAAEARGAIRLSSQCCCFPNEGFYI